MNNVIIRGCIILVSLSLVGAAYASSPIEEEHSSPNACEYPKAMESCCPVYCSRKKSDGAIVATDKFLACASGFGCNRSDTPAFRCEQSNNCK
jgi:hypothetical protein